MSIRCGFVLFINVCELAPFRATLFASMRVTRGQLQKHCHIDVVFLAFVLLLIPLALLPQHSHPVTHILKNRMKKHQHASNKTTLFRCKKFKNKTKNRLIKSFLRYIHCL